MSLLDNRRWRSSIGITQNNPGTGGCFGIARRLERKLADLLVVPWVVGFGKRLCVVVVLPESLELPRA